jgi:hypothetical protein
MSTSPTIKLPRVAVDEKTEKITIVMTLPLRLKLRRFEEFFTEHAGQKPSSFTALIVGVVEDYLDGHRDFQKWNQHRDRRAESDA